MFHRATAILTCLFGAFGLVWITLEVVFHEALSTGPVGVLGVLLLSGCLALLLAGGALVHRGRPGRGGALVATACVLELLLISVAGVAGGFETARHTVTLGGSLIPQLLTGYVVWGGFWGWKQRAREPAAGPGDGSASEPPLLSALTFIGSHDILSMVLEAAGPLEVEVGETGVPETIGILTGLLGDLSAMVMAGGIYFVTAWLAGRMTRARTPGPATGVLMGILYSVIELGVVAAGIRNGLAYDALSLAALPAVLGGCAIGYQVLGRRRPQP